MSVTIRLARTGKRNAPTFKVVVANTRDKRNGKYLEVLGYYNPSKTPAEFKLDEQKFQEWQANGALVSDAVVALRDGTYKFVPYNPGESAGDDETPTGSSDQEKADSEKGEDEPVVEETAAEEAEGDSKEEA